jgi:hypothetical protein
MTVSVLLTIVLCGIVLFGVLATAVLVLATSGRRRRHTPAQHAAPVFVAAPTPGLAPAPITRHGRKSQTDSHLPYARIPQLLTAAERDFYTVLQQAVPEGLVLFAQVRLANLVHPTSRGKQNKYDFYRIQAKCVDFVLCDAVTTAPRLIVELDDSSHEREHRKARDAFVDAVLAHVGLPILHVRWRASYSQVQLATDLREALGLCDTSISLYPPMLPAQTTPPAAALSRIPRTGPEKPPPVLLPAAPPAAVAQPLPVIAAPAHEQRYACGHCQQPVRREAAFCSHCGAVLT